MIHSVNMSVTHGTNEWPEVNLTPCTQPAVEGRQNNRPKESEVKIFGWLRVCCWVGWYRHPSPPKIKIWLYMKQKVCSKCFVTISDIQGAWFVPGSSPICHANITIKKYLKKHNGVALVPRVHGFRNPLLCEPINPVVVKQPLVHWCCGHPN